MWRDDDRGQAIQIGAVLLFGALIIALSGYQAFVVPQQNEQVEFSHSQTVQDQLQDLRNALVSVPGESSSRSVSIALGTRYPERIVAVNPGPPTGALRTLGTETAASSISITNAVTDGETGDVWDGSERTYTTGWLTYRPNYNVYGGAPDTIYESSVLFNEFGTGVVPLSDQSLVDGDDISLVALNGSLDATRTGATSVDVQPVSASTTTVSVANQTETDPVEIRIPTRFSLSTWQTLLADEMVSQGGHVETLRTEPLAGNPDAQTLVVELETGVTYDLQLAKAGVGRRVTDEGEAYMTDVAGNYSAVPEEGSQLLVVEVRDAYNNPVSGVEVTASADGGSLESTTARTGRDGRAKFLYRAPTVTEETDVSVNFSYVVDPGSTPTFDGNAPENVEMTVKVQNSQAGSTPGRSSSGAYSLDWDSPTVTEGGTYLSNCDADDCTWDVGADSDDKLDLIAGTTPEIEGAEVDFAVNNSTVGTVSPGSTPTNSNGEAPTTLTASNNGTIKLYALGPGGTADVINVTVTNVSQGPSTAMRVDDFTDRNGNEPELVASYDVSNAGSSFQRVEITFAAADGDPSGTLQSTSSRGSLSYQPGYGSGEKYDVTAEVIATDSQGNEYVADTASITDTADAVNPSGANADLSEPGSATLDSRTVSDDTNVNGDKVRYKFDYTVSTSGSYSKVRLFALNLNSNGATGTVDRTSRSGNNVKVEPGFGANTRYRVGIAVFDADGAIVQVVDTTDTADGNGTVTLSGTALVLVFFGVTGLRRRFDS